MRYRLAIPLVALALTACGDDSTATNDTTTTTPGATSSTAAPVAEHIATPHALAFLAAQLDDALRQRVVAAEPCLKGRLAECTGPALTSYQEIDDLAAGVISILTESTTKGERLYAGETPEALVGRMDATMNLSAAVKEASQAAQAACVPMKRAGCDDATQTLNDALIELFKIMNQWRHDL